MEQPTPLEAHFADATTLVITWSDRRILHHPAHIVRAKCPCANCKEDDSAADPSTHASVSFLSVDEIGNYALQIGFSDGHNLGIYPFERLQATGYAPGQAPVPEGDNAPFSV